MARHHVRLWIGAVVLAWIAVLLLRSVPIGGTWKALSSETYSYIAVCFAALMIGGWIGSRLDTWSRAPLGEASWGDPAAMTTILSAISLTGALIVIYEFAVVRGYGFSESVNVIRTLEEKRALGGSSPSAFGGAGRLASGAIASAWIAFFMADFKVGRLTLALLIMATLVGFYCEAQFLGGRLMIAAVWTTLAFTYLARTLYRIRRGTSWSLRPAMHLAFWGLAICAYFLAVFAFRIRHKTDTPNDATTAFAEYFRGDLDVASGASSTVAASVRFLWVYVTHGLNELDRLLHTAEIQFAYGAVQFAKVAQALTVLTGQDWRYDTFVNVPSPGLYWTLLGDAYVDFGVAGSMGAVVVLGLLLTWSAGRLLAGSTGPLASSFPILMAIAIFSPMLSLVQNLWPSVAWVFFAWAVVVLWGRAFRGKRRLTRG